MPGEDPRRQIPSVHRLLEHPAVAPWVAKVGHAWAVDTARHLLEEARKAMVSGQTVQSDPEALAQILAFRLAHLAKPFLRRVINATGVVLHTNLGRAPLSPEAVRHLTEIMTGYTNLEFHLETGRRGSRLDLVLPLLRLLTGAEDALVVNNNAAATLLALQVLARRRRVLTARTQLVEIGGSFRIPDILQQSGAKLVAVGTTNKVHLDDYRQILETQPIALVLWVHRSNFRIIGFHAEPTLQEIADLAHTYGCPVVADVGSGALLSTRTLGLPHEPTVQECLQAGADLVCFSGDKLLGGPQAGIIVGRKDLVTRLRKHPLYRALRVDKLTLAALEITLRLYAQGKALTHIPLWQMLTMPPETLAQRVRAWQARLGFGEIRESTSTVGGGSLPETYLPTYVLALPYRHPQRLLHALREQEPPIIARVEGDTVVLDPRTVFPEEEEALLRGVVRAWQAVAAAA